jgi:N-acetylglucosaminyl-diphospho-decaprenol L-rhamnosyltransferase
MTNPITIVIVSYNSSTILQRCLGELIREHHYPVIIIDNASRDNSASKIEKAFPQAKTISLPVNIGYGRAANVGLNEVQTPYALIINPDLIATTSQIKQLLYHALTDQSNTAIWGPASDDLDYTHEHPKSVQWVSGCAMLFNMEKLHKIGLFDENIFLFFEETDLCTRAINAGYKVQHCQDVFFDHLKGAGSTPSRTIEALKDWHYGWSRCYYFNKHAPKNKKRTPLKQYMQYKWKALTSSNINKRRKYRLQSKGAKAFLNGTKAFDKNGLPFIPNVT